MQGPQQTPRREISNVALLDLTGAAAANALEGVTRISDVAAILVPESLLPRVSSIPMHRVAATVPIPDGRRVRVFTGQIVLAGDALAAPADGADETLVVTGQLILTSPAVNVGRDVVVLGQIIAPAGSESGLGLSLRRLTGQVVYYPLPEGARVQVRDGGLMGGEALANPGGEPRDVLLITSTAVLTSSIESIGYQQIVVLGNVLVPRGAESTITGRVQTQAGRVIAYDAPPRVFEGKHSVSAAYFEFLDAPITLVVDGKCSIDDDVTPELIRQKVSGLVLDGKLVAPRRVIPALQVVALVLDGKLVASGDADE
jgi:hypothetical protein